MKMKPPIRKLALTAHIVSSVGWLGAVVAYLALVITAMTSENLQVAQVAYLLMETIGWYVIVPASFAALLTGLLQSLGTPWGLFRHYWVTTKLALTLVATLVLVAHMGQVSQMQELVAQPSFAADDLGQLQIQLVVHAVGGLLVLLGITALSVFKPWGTTAYGQRKQKEGRKGS